MFLGTSWLVVWGARFDDTHPDPFRAARFEDVVATFTEDRRSWGAVLVGLWDWLSTPQPDRLHRALPMVPVGTDNRFAPRRLLEPWPDETELRLIPGRRGALAVRENPSTQPTGIRELASVHESARVWTLGTDGALRIADSDLPSFWRKPALPAPGGREDIKNTTTLQLETPIADFAWNPDGSRVATAAQDGTAVIWDAASSQELAHLQASKAAVSAVAWSPDGSRLATAADDGMAVIWDAAIGQELARLRGDWYRVGGISWSPDGSRVVMTPDNGTALLWDVGSGSAIAALHGARDAALVAWSPDGSRLATTGREGIAVGIWDAENGKPVAEFEGHLASTSAPAWSPDGKHLAAGVSEGQAVVWDAATGQELAHLQASKAGVSVVAWSPDGSRLATAADDGTAVIWDVASSQELAHLQASAGITAVAWSPDGSRLATAADDGMAVIWDAASGQELAPLKARSGAGRTIAWSPDGSRLAVRTADGTVRIFRLPSETTPVLTGLCLGPEGRAWVVGETGYLARSEDDGQHWQRPDVDTQLTLHAVHFVDSARGLAAGERGVIVASSDGGTSWAVQRQPGASAPALRDVFMVGDQAWAVGDSGVVLSRAEGEPWHEVRRLDATRLLSIYIQANGMGWISGERGTRPVLFHAENVADAASWRPLAENSLPAPWWFWLGLPGLLVSGFVAVRAWPAPPAPPPQSIADQAAPDSPISWRDEDLTGLKPLARNLSAFLRNINTEPPLILAVTGRWGSGKSSLMHLLKSDLEYYGAKPVWFNAWHHRKEEHLLAALMENIRAQAIPAWYLWSGLTFRGRLLKLRLRKAALGYLAAATLTGVALLAIVVAKPEVGGLEFASRVQQFWAWARELPAAAEGAFGVLSAVLILWLRSKLTALPVEPAKLLAQVAEGARIRDLREQLGLRFHFGEAFGEVCEALLNRRSPGLVIFIDDLDRCRPENVLEILEAINYFVSAGRCIVILGMDEGQVEHCVGLGFKDVIASLPDDHFQFIYGARPASEAGKLRLYARHYLEKLVNIDVPVPELHEDNGRASSDVLEPSLWLERLKGMHNGTIQLARVGVLAAGLGLAFVWALEITNLLEPSAKAVTMRDGANKGQAGIPPPLAGGTTESASSQEQPPAAGELGTASSQEQPPAAGEVATALVLPVLTVGEITPEEIQDYWYWAWWGPAALLLSIFLFWGLGEALRRQTPVAEDSPKFKQALAITRPFVLVINPTPRAIKRYENRMRYLASCMRSGRPEPDWIDRLLHRLHPRLVPSAWFEPQPEPPLSEPALLMLGAVQLADPEWLVDAGQKAIPAALAEENSQRLKQFAEAREAAERRMRVEFPSAWPPTPEQIDTYLKISRRRTVSGMSLG